MSQNIINTAQIVRQMVLQQVQSIPEELYDVQPQSFNNTIRWNIGHIIFWMDSCMSLCFSVSSTIPATYAAWFNSGTKPSDWTSAPPSMEELMGYLSQQLSTVSAVSPSSLDAPLQSPVQIGPLSFNSVGELFNFAFIHEAIHLSTIACLLRVIQNNG